MNVTATNLNSTSQWAQPLRLMKSLTFYCLVLFLSNSPSSTGWEHTVAMKANKAQPAAYALQISPDT